jgi:subtilisin
MDPGIDIDHEDLDAGSIDGNEFQVAEFLSWNVDGSGHGTHVSGKIAALDNDIGVVGVAPEASIHIVVYLGTKLATGLYVSDIVKGIQLCI